jgi:hypothetical protein
MAACVLRISNRGRSSFLLAPTRREQWRGNETQFLMNHMKMNVLPEISEASLPDSIEPKLKAPTHCPSSPRNLADLKIPHSVITDLMLRHLRTHGVSSFSSLNVYMKIAPPIIRVLFEGMRQQQLVEVKGLTGQDYSFELTTAGRNLGGRALANV